MAEHSRCQPGRPRPHGVSQLGSPGFVDFHMAKSRLSRQRQVEDARLSHEPGSVEAGSIVVTGDHDQVCFLEANGNVLAPCHVWTHITQPVAI